MAYSIRGSVVRDRATSEEPVDPPPEAGSSEDTTTAEPVPLDETAANGGEPAAGRPRRRPWFRWFAIAWLVVLLSLAIAAPWLPMPDPTEGGLGIAKPPSADRIFGTDQIGRDIFSRVVYGARTSLFVGITSVGIAAILGVLIGVFAGYFGGKLDTLTTAVADVILAFPGLVLLLAVVVLVGPAVRNLVFAFVVFQLPTFIRLSRASAIAFAQRTFVLAARGLGARQWRVALVEILPNVVPAVSAYAMAAVGIVFVSEGSLSFLGLGIQPPTPAWGSMVAAGRPRVDTAPHISLVPATVLFITVLCFNALSDMRRGARASGLAG